jgi:hypothetical protein
MSTLKRVKMEAKSAMLGSVASICSSTYLHAQVSLYSIIIKKANENRSKKEAEFPIIRYSVSKIKYNQEPGPVGNKEKEVGCTYSTTKSFSASPFSASSAPLFPSSLASELAPSCLRSFFFCDGVSGRSERKRSPSCALHSC